MVCNNGYTIDCCGSANRFQYFTKNNGDIEFMIWRPQADGTIYDLVWSVSETVTGVDPNVGGEFRKYIDTETINRE